jgi:hypothetical protein
MLAPHTNPETVNWDGKRDLVDSENAAVTLVQRPQSEVEGMIPVIAVDSRIFYVVDCPQLHIVDERDLFPEGDPSGLWVSALIQVPA